MNILMVFKKLFHNKYINFGFNQRKNHIMISFKIQTINLKKFLILLIHTKIKLIQRSRDKFKLLKGENFYHKKKILQHLGHSNRLTIILTIQMKLMDLLII